MKRLSKDAAYMMNIKDAIKTTMKIDKLSLKSDDGDKAATAELIRIEKYLFAAGYDYHTESDDSSYYYHGVILSSPTGKDLRYNGTYDTIDIVPHDNPDNPPFPGPESQRASSLLAAMKKRI